MHFSPRGKPGRPDEIELKFEEFEAVKLIDYIGLSQKKAASLMGISQQTFSRVFRRAHKAIANGLILGKIIRIRGGNYDLTGHVHIQPQEQKHLKRASRSRQSRAVRKKSI